MRVTWSGEFVHAAPWSTGDQGRANVSHGCVGMSMSNAIWLFNQSTIGDVVQGRRLAAQPRARQRLHRLERLVGRLAGGQRAAGRRGAHVLTSAADRIAASRPAWRAVAHRVSPAVSIAVLTRDLRVHDNPMLDGAARTPRRGRAAVRAGPGDPALGLQPAQPRPVPARVACGTWTPPSRDRGAGLVVRRRRLGRRRSLERRGADRRDERARRRRRHALRPSAASNGCARRCGDRVELVVHDETLFVVPPGRRRAERRRQGPHGRVHAVLPPVGAAPDAATLAPTPRSLHLPARLAKGRLPASTRDRVRPVSPDLARRWARPPAARRMTALAARRPRRLRRRPRRPRQRQHQPALAVPALRLPVAPRAGAAGRRSRAARRPRRSSGRWPGATSTPRCSRRGRRSRRRTTAHAATAGTAAPRSSRPGRRAAPATRRRRRDAAARPRGLDAQPRPADHRRTSCARRCTSTGGRAPSTSSTCCSTADVASNTMNWQWVAGTGTDSRFNRTYNVMLQAPAARPAGAYVRRYVEELAGVDDGYVHEPWLLPEDELAKLGYPAPIVDQDEARERMRTGPLSEPPDAAAARRPGRCCGPCRRRRSPWNGATAHQYGGPSSPRGWKSARCRTSSGPAVARRVRRRSSSQARPGSRISARSRSSRPASISSTRQKSSVSPT